MTERAPIPKKLRFEVFKRDSFTCQYCGAAGGQVLLHCDHIKPVAEGGETTLLNLVTACVECNLGKGARQLSDDSAVTKQHRQLADLEERRQQLEMMRDWREELAQHQVSEIDIVAEAFLARSKFKPSDHGNISVRRWLRKYGLHEVLAAIDETFDLYFTADTDDEWDRAFARIPRVLGMREQEKVDPHIRKMLYIQGILRRRFADPRGQYIEGIREAIAKSYPIDVLESLAKTADSWSGYVGTLNAYAAQQKRPEKPVEKDEPEEAEDEGPELIFGPESQEYGELFAGCFTGYAGDVLKFVSELVWIEGYADAEAHPNDVPLMRGLWAVGLISSFGAAKDIAKLNKEGKLVWSFRYRPIRPTDVASCFNRFGTLKLSFWEAAGHFAPVHAVH